MSVEPTEFAALGDFGPQRSRSVAWYEPGPVTAKGLSMAGLDYLRALKNRELPSPPISELPAAEPSHRSR